MRDDIGVLPQHGSGGLREGDDHFEGELALHVVEARVSTELQGGQQKLRGELVAKREARLAGSRLPSD